MKSSAGSHFKHTPQLMLLEFCTSTSPGRKRLFKDAGRLQQI